MFNLISIYIPPFKVQPDNYMMVNARIFGSYHNNYLYSEEDRKIYIITQDSLQEVIAKANFESSHTCEDYKFEDVGFHTQGLPEPVQQWISNLNAAREQLRNFLYTIAPNMV